MGKIKHESDDDADAMDIQHPIPAKKKNKLISKNKPAAQKVTSSKPSQIISKVNVLNKFAKMVNLKNRHQPLDHKQAIFQRIVEGLKDKNKLSKKNKKKTRVLLKKELRKHLDQQRVHNRKKSTYGVDSTMDNTRITMNPQKAKKKQVNERAQIASFHQLMGAGLQNIRNIVAKNSSSNK